MSITAIKNRLEMDTEQQIIDIVENWPMLHFSEQAGTIIEEGFRIGAPLRAIHLTGNVGEQYTPAEKGINFAFNVLEYCAERDVPDFMVGIDSNLMGMYSDKAALFLGSGVYTHHHDEFNQIIFDGDNVKKNTFILLESQGFEEDEDGEPICDENGNEVEFWAAKDQLGNIVTDNEQLTLEECVEKATHYLLSHYKADAKAYEEFGLMFNNCNKPPTTKNKNKPK